MPSLDILLNSRPHFVCQIAVLGMRASGVNRPGDHRGGVDVTLTGHTKPKVLIVDDEPIIAGTVAVILNQGGFQAVGVDGGDEAIRCAGEWQPDILVTDFVMSGLNGLEVAKRIYVMLPRCRIFLFSARYDVADEVLACCEAGYPFKFILKPVHPLELLGTLRAAIEKSDQL